ncbi:Vacuolar fusion protein mon1 [Microbotryomycetes sp. JL221]|nr:Vacuolar fusion protein mon1 [Microbotryomycetes sp. JL221]
MRHKQDEVEDTHKSLAPQSLTHNTAKVTRASTTSSPSSAASSPTRQHRQSGTAASHTLSPPLPSLLLGLRSSSSRANATTTALSRPSTPATKAPSSVIRSKARPTHARIQSSSNASDSSSALAVETAHETRDDSDHNSSTSDASSEFEGLLERVGAIKRSREPVTATQADAATERSQQTEVDIDNQLNDRTTLVQDPNETLQQMLGGAHRLSKGKGKAALVDQEEAMTIAVDDDESVEPVLEDNESAIGDAGKTDPRDMLRAQLKRSESVGKQPRLTSLASSRDLAASLSSIELASGHSVPARYQPRQYFMLSSAGKLIFTTEKDEEEATNFVGVMQAIISIFADERDRLRYIDAGKTKIAFVLKPPIYLVVVSDWGEPESILRTHLDYLYLQVLSVITHSQLTSIFSKRSNFDLRRLMEGTESFFTTLTATMQHSLSTFTSALEVFRIDVRVRDDVAKVLSVPKAKSLSNSLSVLYAMVISSGRLVTLLRPSSHSIHPADLHILLSTISSSRTFMTPEGESWIPICLPRFNNKGFLHCYISYVTESTGVVLVGAERDKFEGIKEWAEVVKTKLKDGGLVHKLDKNKAAQRYSLAELAVPGLRHFLYKSKLHVQVTHPTFEGDYEDDDNRHRLITLYQRVHEIVHPRPAHAGPSTSHGPAKLAYLRTDHEAVLGWMTSKFELYVAVSPLLPKTAVVSVARAVSRWIKPEEHFLLSAPSF